ncbi:HhH-GPD family protein [Chitinimonas naiadis]
MSIRRFEGRPSHARVRRFQTRLLAWFELCGREFPWRQSDAGLYEKVVVEVLLQRTRAETVARFLPNFLHSYPGWREIAEASEDELAVVLRPLGLWRRRGVSLRGLARSLVAMAYTWPGERAKLESLPAVGQYVANAVLLFVHRQREPLMDASMARLLRRYFGLPQVRVDIRDDELLHDTAYAVLVSGDAVILNWAMLDLAALICRPSKPKCHECPISSSCRYRRSEIS